jgi:endonuclease G
MGVLWGKVKEKSGQLISQDKTVDINYGAFQINYSCMHRGFNYVTYKTVPDTGVNKNYTEFNHETRLLKSACMPQVRATPYKNDGSVEEYRRGHGVHQNIFDHDFEMMKSVNKMTNVVPHNSVQSETGLWHHLEKRIECARDIVDVQVWSGNDWGDDASNDYFKKSHGVTTPDKIWRVHVYKDTPGQAYAWLIPNNEVATMETESQYRVSLLSLKFELNDDYEFPVPDSLTDGWKQDPYKNITCSLE